MPEFVAAAAYIEDYINFLQLAAITGVASVIILNASSDMFALESTGTQEIGTGRLIVAQKYRGWIADGCRSFVFIVSGSLASTYSVLILLITASTIVIALGTGCDDLMSLTADSSKTGVPIKKTVMPQISLQAIPIAAPEPKSQQGDLPPAETQKDLLDTPHIESASCLTQWVAQRLPWDHALLKSAIFKPGPLRTVFLFVVSMTIVAACWIAFLSTILRWSHMRRSNAGLDS